MYTAVKSQIAGIAVVEAAKEIVSEGYAQGGIDNKLCRDQVITQAYAAVRELGITASDFRKEVLDRVYGR